MPVTVDIIHAVGCRLGDILLTDTTGFLERADIDDALVCHTSVASSLENRVLRLQPLSQIVGIKDRHLGRCFKHLAEFVAGEMSLSLAWRKDNDSLTLANLIALADASV